MGVAADRVTVDDTAGGVEIVAHPTTSGGPEGDYPNKRVVIVNQTGTGSIFLGPPEDGSALSAANGFEWKPEHGALSFELEPTEHVQGFAAVDQEVHVYYNGR